MDKTTTITFKGGEFTIKNELTVGEELSIDVARATMSKGMYGQMIESPNMPELTAGWRIYRLAELNGRIETSPEDFKGCASLSRDDFDEFWKVWTEKSGNFLNLAPESDGKKDGAGEGSD